MDWEQDQSLQERLAQLVTEGYKQSEILHVVRKQFNHYSWR